MQACLVGKVAAHVQYKCLAVVKTGISVDPVIFVLYDHHDSGKAYGLSEKLHLQIGVNKLRHDTRKCDDDRDI